jgi:hypothetical protein
MKIEDSNENIKQQNESVPKIKENVNGSLNQTLEIISTDKEGLFGTDKSTHNQVSH